MLDRQFLIAAAELFWPVYVAALLFTAWAFVRDGTRPWNMARAVVALAGGSAAQTVLEQHIGPLGPLHHFGIDLAVVAVITMPPRNFWQAALGGLVTGQLVLHLLWWMRPELALTHYAGCLALGFAKCLVLFLWAGGARVGLVVNRLAGGFAYLGAAARGGQPAR